MILPHLAYWDKKNFKAWKHTEDLSIIDKEDGYSLLMVYLGLCPWRKNKIYHEVVTALIKACKYSLRRRAKDGKTALICAI